MTNALIGQVASEALRTNAAGNALVGQVAVEALRANPAGNALIAQVALEVLRTNIPPPPPPEALAWGTFSSTNTKTLTISNGYANEQIVVFVGYELNTAQRNVTSVTSAHLTFTKRKQYQSGLLDHTTVEEWLALASTVLTSEVITITLDANIDDGCAAAVGIPGTYTASPYDPSASFPYTANSNAAGNPSITYTTTNVDDVLLCCQVGDASGSNATAPGGWNQLYSFMNNGGGLYCGFYVGYKQDSAVETGVTVTNTGGVGTAHIAMLLDAFTYDAPSGGGGGGGGGSSSGSGAHHHVICC